MTDILIVAAWTIASYLLGTVSFGDIVARIAGVDIRSVGTKNPGAANIYRQIGPKYGIAVFALDVAKGAVATAPLLALDIYSWAPLAAAFAVVLGHIFPVFAIKSGGTGMATAIGTTAGLAPFGLLAGVPAALGHAGHHAKLRPYGRRTDTGNGVTGWACGAERGRGAWSARHRCRRAR